MQIFNQGVQINTKKGPLLLKISSELQWLHFCNISASVNRMERCLLGSKPRESIVLMGDRFLNELAKTIEPADYNLLLDLIEEAKE